MKSLLIVPDVVIVKVSHLIGTETTFFHFDHVMQNICYEEVP